MIFDTHAHYDDEAFEEDRGALIASLAEQGIGRVVNVAADLASVSTSLTLAQQYPFIYAAVGVHPSNVQELTERDYEWLEEKLAAPKAVAKSPMCRRVSGKAFPDSFSLPKSWISLSSSTPEMRQRTRWM